MPRRSSEQVTIRAFRGTRRSSVYRDHAVPAAAFARIRAVARERGLGVVAALDPETPELDKRKARDLARETDGLRRSAELLELDADLAAIGEIARWCARATGKAWLEIATTR